jgi:hypothetical protein
VGGRTSANDERCRVIQRGSVCPNRNYMPGEGADTFGEFFVSADSSY